MRQVRVKAAVVREDEREGGLRAILNWGCAQSPGPRFAAIGSVRCISLARSLARACPLRHRQSPRCVFTASAAIGAELFSRVGVCRGLRAATAAKGAVRCALCACVRMGEDSGAEPSRAPVDQCAHTAASGTARLQAHGRPRGRDAVPAVDAARRGHRHRHGQGGRGRQARRTPARLYGEHSEAANAPLACHVAVRLRFAAHARAAWQVDGALRAGRRRPRAPPLPHRRRSRLRVCRVLLSPRPFPPSASSGCAPGRCRHRLRIGAHVASCPRARPAAAALLPLPCSQRLSQRLHRAAGGLRGYP